MIFNSYIFILCFFPILVVGYFIASRIRMTLGHLFLLGMSIWFYVYAGKDNIWPLTVSILVNLLCVQLIRWDCVRKRINLCKAVYIASLVFNIAMLDCFKYILINGIVMPVGISFYSFQQVAYIVSIYREERQEDSLLDYLLYILYFPKLIMGPITEPADIIPQFHDENKRVPIASNIASGLRLFGYGLFKKILFADAFGIVVNWAFPNIDSITPADAVFVMLAYTLEIYFDFSGYSDMAVGISRILNIDLPRNFDSPYKAISIRDFWKRWHISLTKFLTKYIYIPLGGNKKGAVRTYINTVLVFVLSGMWHGSTWTFVLWGSLHGIFSVMERLYADVVNNRSQGKIVDVQHDGSKVGVLFYRVKCLIQWGVTFLLINIMWLLFRSDSVKQWLTLMKKMVAIRNISLSDGFIQQFKFPAWEAFRYALHLDFLNYVPRIDKIYILVFFAIAIMLCIIPKNNYETKDKLTIGGAVLSALAFLFAFISMGSEAVFVYFQF